MVCVILTEEQRMKKKIQTEIDSAYEQMRCLLCKFPHVTSHIIGLQNIDKFIICNGCLKDFRDATKHLD